MNIFILKAMRYLDNPELFTKREIVKNASDAVDAYTAAVVDTDKYFKITSENKQDYINEVERLRWTYLY
mgnify:CR=1 FL=1